MSSFAWGTQKFHNPPIKTNKKNQKQNPSYFSKCKTLSYIHLPKILSKFPSTELYSLRKHSSSMRCALKKVFCAKKKKKILCAGIAKALRNFARRNKETNKTKEQKKSWIYPLNSAIKHYPHLFDHRTVFFNLSIIRTTDTCRTDSSRKQTLVRTHLPDPAENSL